MRAESSAGYLCMSFNGRAVQVIESYLGWVYFLELHEDVMEMQD